MQKQSIDVSGEMRLVKAHDIPNINDSSGKVRSLRVIAYKPELAFLFDGDIETAIFMQQLIHWSQYSTRKDGAVYKTAKEMYQETCISEYKQRRCRRRLTEAGWIEAEKKMANGSPTWHYKVLVTELTLWEPTGDSTVPNSKTPSSITKNTHNITNYVKNKDSVDRLYKGWLIEMVIGRQKFMATAEGSQARADLLESASRKTRLTDKRKQKLASRIDSLGVELCSKAIVNIGRSDFHKGQNDRKWKATLEWLFNTDEKVEEFANR